MYFVNSFNICLRCCRRIKKKNYNEFSKIAQKGGCQEKNNFIIYFEILMSLYFYVHM